MLTDITLQEVTSENWRTIANLMVLPQQQHTIESNKDSLLEAAFDSSFNWLPLGIYLNNLPIGFTMIGALDEIPGTVWIDRFMIDHHYQGKSLGKQSFILILNFMNSNFKDKDIILSVHETNTFAISFYESFGFQLTGTTDPSNNELIMKLSNK